MVKLWLWKAGYGNQPGLENGYGERHGFRFRNSSRILHRMRERQASGIGNIGDSGQQWF
jgi:hypothetical protein